MMSKDEQDEFRQLSWHRQYVPLVLGTLLAAAYGLFALFVLVTEAQWPALTALPFAYWIGGGCVLRNRRLMSGSVQATAAMADRRRFGPS